MAIDICEICYIRSFVDVLPNNDQSLAFLSHS